MALFFTFTETVYAVPSPNDIVTELERQEAYNRYGIEIPREPDREKYREKLERYEGRREKQGDIRDDYEDEVEEYNDAVQAYREAVEGDDSYWNYKIARVLDHAAEYIEEIDRNLEIYNVEVFEEWGLILNAVQPVEPDRPEYDIVDNYKYDIYKDYTQELLHYSNTLKWLVEDYLEIEASREDKGIVSGRLAGRFVQDVGCYLNQDKCYISFTDFEKYGPMTCAEKVLYWDTSSATGKKLFSMLMSAYVTKNSVTLYVSDQCLDGRPTFDYVTLTN